MSEVLANLQKSGGGLPFKEIAFASYHWNGQIGNINSGVIVKKDMTVINGGSANGDFLKLAAYASASQKETQVIAKVSGKYYYKVTRGSTTTESTVTVSANAMIVKVNGWTSSNDYCCVIALN